MSKIGNRIREAREAKGLDQIQLGELTGYFQSSLSDVERGKVLPRHNKLIALSEVLDVPLEELRALVAEDAKARRQRAQATPQDRETAKRMVEANYASPAPAPIHPSFTPMTTSFPVITPNATLGGPVIPSDSDVIPAFGQVRGGSDGRYQFNGQVIGWEPRPAKLRGVAGVYAVYIDGDSMYPRYKAGETVVANPGRPVSVGDDVIVQIAPDVDGDAPYGFVKEFVKFTPTKLILTQHNPPIQIEFDRELVISVHRIDSAYR